jgi:hypothetical protein
VAGARTSTACLHPAIPAGAGEVNAVQYMLLIYETDEDFRARSGDHSQQYFAAWRAYYRCLVEADVYVGGDALMAAATATTVRLQGGKRHVQDGPFADTKEQLGGYIVLELPSLDAALDFAARCPAAATGAVEVRPLQHDVRERVVH